MPPLRTTAGQIAANAALPAELRDYNRVLDKKGTTELLQRLAQEHPDQYREAVQRLSNLGRQAAYRSGGYGFGLKHLAPAQATLKSRQALHAELDSLFAKHKGDPRALAESIVQATGKHQRSLPDEIYRESLAEKNPIAMQVASGARGNQLNLSALRGSDLLYTDQDDRVVPIPVMHSFSEGLTPAEYIAGSFGARQAIIQTKLAVARAGYLSKQMGRAAHRLIVTAKDEDDERDGADDGYGDDPPKPTALRGFPVGVDDRDNEGALLAAPAGGYPRNTLLTAKIQAELKRKGIERILVRSPTVGGPRAGGVYANDLGLREDGRLLDRGAQVGQLAAQVFGEKLAQGQLGAKHGGGVAAAGARPTGFKAVSNLVEAPQVFAGQATLASDDGRVQHVIPSPAGGFLVRVGNKDHFIPHGQNVVVKPGQEIEAGDSLSDGVPNPKEITHYKGVGEGRRYFTAAFHQAAKDFGIKASRRNVEVLARGLIDHVRLTEERGHNVPGDVVSYAALEHEYEPREGARELSPDKAQGQYLEAPVLHYTIGTKIRPSVIRTLKNYNVTSINTHPAPPPFESEMIRSADTLRHDPDWLTRLYGSGQKASLLDAVHRGSTSDEAGTSFVPGLARATGFGTYGAVGGGSLRKPPPPLPTVPSRGIGPDLAKAAGVDMHGQPTGDGPGVTATPIAAPDSSPNFSHSLKQIGTSLRTLTAGRGSATQDWQRPDYSSEVQSFDPHNLPAPKPVEAAPTPNSTWWGGDEHDLSPDLTAGQSALRAGKSIVAPAMAGAGLNLLGQTGSNWWAGKPLSAPQGWHSPMTKPPGFIQGAMQSAKNPMSWARGAKGLAGSTLAFNTGLDLAVHTGEAGRNLKALYNGQDYDPGAQEKNLNNAMELSEANPVARAAYAAQNPVKTIAAGGAAVGHGAEQIADIRANRDNADMVDQRAQKATAGRQAELSSKHQRWMAHLQQTGADPNVPWQDPVTGTQYTRAEFDDYQAGQAQQTQSQFSRDTKGMPYSDRSWYDTASPFSLGWDARVPGTNRRLWAPWQAKE